MTKAQLRKIIKDKRDSLTEEYIKTSSCEIADTLINCPEFINAKSVFVFLSTEKEPDTSKIIKEALKTGKTVYVPKCISKGIMIPVKITEETKFSEGYMAISEPEEYDKDLCLTQIDLSVIPCISASPAGERLGHGAGFYDIFLKNVNTYKICLCFRKLLSEFIPTDENDVKTDMVITEQGKISI